MLTFDTLWYHGPFAARIADTGSVWGMHFIDPLYLNWFYPQNSELLHAAGIVLFDRDLFEPAGQLRLARGRPARGLVHRTAVRGRAAQPGRGLHRDGHGADGAARGGHAGDGHGSGRPAAGGGGDPDQRLGDADRGRGGEEALARVPGVAAVRRAAGRGAGDGSRTGQQADDLRSDRRDGDRRRLPRPQGRSAQGLRRLPRGRRRHRRLLVPPEPDPRRQSAALGPAHRADRPARPEPRARGPRRLHRRPLHLLQPEHRPLARLLPQPDREPAGAALVPDPRRCGRGRGARRLATRARARCGWQGR